jgi:hypothetical protein
MNAFRTLKCSLLFSLGFVAQGITQEIDWQGTPQRTALKIVCDTPGTPIYVDGHLVGEAPLEGLIDVQPGWHRVSYFPDSELNAETPSPGKRTVRDILYLGRQDVLVEHGEIVRVVLSYRSLEAEVAAYERKLASSQWIGYGMLLAVVAILIWAYT